MRIEERGDVQRYFPLGSTDVQKNRERISAEELGNLLAAVGNHEAKALLISSLVRGRVYTSNDLDTLVREKQGGHSVWKMSRGNVLDNYLEKSFLSSELVFPIPTKTGVSGYVLTDYGVVAMALAGHLLDFSFKNPGISLIDFFGSTKNNTESTQIETRFGKKEYKKRAPFVRYKIFKELLGENPPQTQTELALKIGESQNRTGRHLESLSQVGIITYRSTQKDQPFAHFRVSPDILKVREKPKTLVDRIRGILLRDKSADITTEYVTTQLLEQFPSYKFFNRRWVRKSVAKRLSYLKNEKGYLIGTEKKGHSRVSKELSALHRSHTGFRGEVHEIIIRAKDANISVDYIYKALMDKNPNRPQLDRHVIANILSAFEEKGYLIRVGLSATRQSEIKLTVEQRAVLLDLVEILDRFRQQNGDFRREGRTLAQEIVGDPRKFSKLLLKAKRASSQRNITREADLREQILTVLSNYPGITNSRIQEYLRVFSRKKRALSKARISEVTRALRKERKIMVVGKGSSFHYSLSPQSA